MSQSIIFTCLPQYKKQEESNKLFISVLASIRLSPNNATTLNQYPDMLAWAQKVKAGNYSFRFNNQQLEATLNVEQIDESLWSQLMHKDIKVRAFEGDNLTNRRLHSYPVHHVHSYLMQQYRKIALENPDRLIPVTKLLDPASGFSAISRYRLNPDFAKDINESQSGVTHKPAREEIKESQLIIKDETFDNRVTAALKLNKFIPYKASPEPSMDFAQFRDFHRYGREGRTTPLPQIEKPDFEFHDILSVISSYPQLQRKLGLVLDFEVESQQSLQVSGNIYLVPTDLNLNNSTKIACTQTAYGLDDNGIFSRNGEDSLIDRGLIKINTDKFAVHQVDADGAALKLTNFVENKVIELAKQLTNVFNLSGSNTLAAKNIQVDPPEGDGLPPMRSAGLAISANGQAGLLHQKFNKAVSQNANVFAAAALNNNLGIYLPNTPLFEEDITQGYRFDIAYSEEPDTWYSLHFKQDEMKFYDAGGNAFSIENIDVDEGFIQLSVAEDTESEEDFYLPESLCRWEGWSLSVNKPGYAVNEPDDDHERDYVNTNKDDEAHKYKRAKDAEFRLETTPAIVPGTLPRLRFGKTYLLKVRAVDMAGNSPSLQLFPHNPAQTMIRGIVYRRFEPTTSPILLAGNTYRDGETLDKLVVRSNFDKTVQAFEQSFSTTFKDDSVRHLLPPRGSQELAELHGKFDKALGNNAQVAKKMYELITFKESHYAPGADGKDKVFSFSEAEVIYLPDPMAAGVSFFLAPDSSKTHSQQFTHRMFSFFKNEEVGNNTNINIPEATWYEAKAIHIRIVEGNHNTNWDASKRIFTVHLPKGERLKICYSTWWREQDLEEASGIWKMLSIGSPANLQQLKDLVVKGKHWMISPSRILELSHVVQQPVNAPEIIEIYADRDYDDTMATIHAKMSVHGFSTEMVDLLSNWQEPYDRPYKNEPEEIERSGIITDISIDYTDSTKQRGNFPKPGSQPGLNVHSAKWDQRPLDQEFGDTKHRMVTFQMEGTSRYAEHFEALIQSNQVPITRLGNPTQKVIVPSSARPLKPEIEYIIPTLEWRKTDTPGRMIHRRLGGGLRVYLKRPWYSSGENEKLAVILPGKPKNSFQATLSAVQPFNPMLTHWGVDPIKLSLPAEAHHPAPANFRHQPHIDQNLAHPQQANAGLTAVAYPVEFDNERKLWFADMAIDHGLMYFPFIKLALARYQEHSVRKDNTDVCLSEIANTDFIQLLPERVCEVDFRRDDQNTRFTVKISGIMSLVGGARFSPSNYFVISFLATELAQPAKMVIDDSTNEKRLEDERTTIHLSEKDISGGKFSIEREFRLARRFKNAPFLIIIQEYELGTVQAGGNKATINSFQSATEENQPRMVFADRFDVNANN